MSIDELLRRARFERDAGRTREAGDLYCEVLSVEPGNQAALVEMSAMLGATGGVGAVLGFLDSLLGKAPCNAGALAVLISVFRSVGRLEEALPRLRRAVEEASETGQFALLEANVLEELGRPADAVECLRAACERFEQNFGLWEKRARLLGSLGRGEEAVAALRRCVGLCPTSSEVICELGVALDGMGRSVEAMDCFSAAFRLDTGSFSALHLLGTSLFERGEFQGAMDAYQKALAIHPGSLPTLNNLGVALVKGGGFEAGAEILRFVVAQEPGWFAAWLNLGVALRETGATREAVEALSKAVELKPDSVEGWSARAAALLRAGCCEEAAECFQRSHRLDPANAALHSDFLFASNYLPGIGAAERFAWYRKFAELHERPFLKGRRGNFRAEGEARKLRVGYVSGDFCLHSVFFFIEPVLRAHDRERFEVFCYSNRARQDRLTDLLSSQCDQWREVHEWDDAVLEEVIRNDGIDILVDLSGHTARNRMTLFARKPAPVQFTMIGCMQSTGLDAVGYRITDGLMDPAGWTEDLHSEELVRLKAGPFVFSPPSNAPKVEAAPCVSRGYVTFGSFNNSAKITERVTEAWAAVLKAVPDSRLLMVGTQENLAAKRLVELGVEPSRIRVEERCALIDYLSMHREVDGLLDTFPYNGLTVTLFAAWMGVPCLTVAGRDAASRAGEAINRRLGLGGWIAGDVGELAEVARALVGDHARLAELREGLRERVRASFCDGEGFTRELEGEYLRALGRWAASGSGQAGGVSVAERLESARLLRKAGLRGEARVKLSGVLEEEPGNVDALLEMAGLAGEAGMSEERKGLLRAAWEIAPKKEGVFEGLEECLEGLEDWTGLERIYRGMSAEQPENADVVMKLGRTLKRMGREEEALDCYKRAVELSGCGRQYVDVVVRELSMDRGRNGEALEWLEKAEPEQERTFASWMLEGRVFFKQGRLLKARRALMRAIGEDPSDAHARAGLAAVCGELSMSAEALQLLESADRLKPGDMEIQTDLAEALHRIEDMGAAERIFREVIKKGGNARAYLNFGTLLSRTGRNREAMEMFRKSLELDPESVVAASNICFVMNYVEEFTAAEVFAEYQRYSERFEKPLISRRPAHSNVRNPSKKLRIGYVSADLRDHSVSFFMEAFFKGRDRGAFGVVGYYNHPLMDGLSEGYRKQADLWRVIYKKSDEEVERMIREDGVDILVELSGHTSGNRLPVFARKPAPVQVTMIGCMQSSGLQGMDYRITDRWLDPEGMTEHLHSERLVRLETGAFCFTPPEDAPQVNELPALRKGQIRFASFNNQAKVTRRVVRCWAGVLGVVPNSTILVLGREAWRVREMLGEYGVAPERVDVGARLPRTEYLRLHQEVDVLLDTFPYNGLTISSLAAWMGVPCVTIEGDCAAARAGSAIMHRLGLPEFVALSEQEFVSRAKSVVGDLDGLNEIRRSLRERCVSSIANHPAHVREVEAAYRRMWETWCANA